MEFKTTTHPQSFCDIVVRHERIVGTRLIATFSAPVSQSQKHDSSIKRSVKLKPFKDDCCGSVFPVNDHVVNGNRKNSSLLTWVRLLAISKGFFLSRA